jgi:hypothetical protein
LKAAKIEDLELAVHMGRVAVLLHRKSVAELGKAGESRQTVQLARQKLELVEEAHAEDFQLRRLTTN